MKISLATSLHLNHGGMSPDTEPGATLPMQAFVPMGLLCLKAFVDESSLGAHVRVTEINALINDGPALVPWRPEQSVGANGEGGIPNDAEFYERIVDAIWRPGDDMVGLMTDADSLHHTVLIASQLKRRAPDTIVCLGGPGSSPIGSFLLDAFPFIDFVVRGEGELTFAELLEALQNGKTVENVLGVTWRRGDEPVDNGDRPVVSDVDELPLPAFEAHDMESGAPLYLDVGRGCPFKCHFCATAPFWSRRYRMKSIDRIVDELRLVRDRYGRRQVGFSHDIFTCDNRWTERFCDRLVYEGLGLSWSCSTRTDIITPALLEKLAAAGCEEIYYGIETGSTRMQAEIHKNLDLDWARKIVCATRAVGIRPVTGFIVGYPTETPETLRDTLEKFFDFLEVGGHRAHLFTLCPFPESPMFREHQKAISRPAEYYDLPLLPQVAESAARLKREHPHIFSSHSRFDTPNLPSDLVDASEELSSGLVVLKTLWPLLLPHYESALDWYSRWTAWIEAENRGQRPNTPMPHQGDAVDLLRFVGEELARLGMTESDIAVLVQYELMKSEARKLPRREASPGGSSGEVEPHPDSIFLRSDHYLLAPFDRDLRSLLSRESSDLPVSTSPAGVWVAFLRTSSNEVTTLQLGVLSGWILNESERPSPGTALVARALARLGLDVQGHAEEGYRAMAELVREGLLVEVAA